MDTMAEITVPTPAEPGFNRLLPTFFFLLEILSPNLVSQLVSSKE